MSDDYGYFPDNDPPSGGGDGGGVAVIVMLSCVGMAIKLFWDFTSNWQTHDMPYSIVAAFYYYTIAVPVATGLDIYSWVDQLNLTSEPIGLAIPLVGAGFFYLGIFFLIRLAIGKFKSFFKIEDNGFVFLLFATPAILGVLWSFILVLFNWAVS